MPIRNVRFHAPSGDSSYSSMIRRSVCPRDLVEWQKKSTRGIYLDFAGEIHPVVGKITYCQEDGGSWLVPLTRRVVAYDDRDDTIVDILIPR